MADLGPGELAYTGFTLTDSLMAPTTGCQRYTSNEHHAWRADLGATDQASSGTLNTARRKQSPMLDLIYRNRLA